MSLDILAIGPHADDVEIGAGAALAAAAEAGLRVGILDLTRGDRSTNGTPEERVQEAQAAARVLGAAGRWNAGMPDRGLTGDAAQVRTVAEQLVRHKPRLVLAPWWGDRHPDHRAAAHLVAEALYEAGLLALRETQPPSDDQPSPWRAPDTLLFYFIDDTPPTASTPGHLPALPPTPEAGTLLLIPAAARHYEQKRLALAAHASQFGGRPGDRPTSLNTAGGLLRWMETREAHFGSLVGAEQAEGFVRVGPWTVPGLADLTAGGGQSRHAGDRPLARENMTRTKGERP